MHSLGVVELPNVDSKENTNRDQQEMAYFGKAQQLKAGSLQYRVHLRLVTSLNLPNTTTLGAVCRCQVDATGRALMKRQAMVDEKEDN